MKQYYLKERDALEHSRKNAGSKARNDVETILDAVGFEPVDVVIPYKKVNTVVGAVTTTIHNYRFWKKQLKGLAAGDHVLMQFPPRSHSALFPNLVRDLRKRDITVTFLIHDLETMRYKDTSELPLMKRMRIFLEETRLIRAADFIICHNEKMKGYLKDQGLSEEKLIPLGIFDYLTGFDPEASEANRQKDGKRDRVIIAGNLSPEKCVYLNDLGKVDGVRFQLYGVGYQDLGQDNVFYQGSFLPDELVGELRGDFGLVWDGTSIETCSGNFGNYLRLNDPHKLSLYLTAGLPVVVWEEAAVADFVRAEHVGITVTSLNELGAKLEALSEEDYEAMRQNACHISRLTRDGHYLKTAITKGLQ
ncbi:MAG: galactofuranosyltransferase [Clostridia bacterium]|nr:galactofuranosyltransferase [Clostridia bacterium]